MSLFNSESGNILLDPKWLEPLSEPPGGTPLCRNMTLKVMAGYLSGIFRTGKARNIFIYGKPGTGKTVCAKHLLSEVVTHAAQTNSPILTAYVNAGKTRTPYYTMAELLKQLGVNVPCAGWQMFRLKQAFEQLLVDKFVLIAIDEVDSIIFKEKEPLVYYLNRQPNTTLILISNNAEDVIRLPERALSTLQPSMIRLEPYVFEEMRQILKERVAHVFKLGAVTDRLIDQVAREACEAGDVRLGFQVLLSAALLAEAAHKQTIEPGDIQAAIKDENNVRTLREADALREKLLELKRKYERG